jgi:rhodanese-related sulfurtransferase
MFGLGVPTVGVDQLEAKLREGGVVLIDVREPDEFASGHVPSAVNVPLKTLPAALPSFDPAAETYVICQTGHRSAAAVKIMRREGFTHAFSVRGGTSAWRGRLER